MTDAAQAQAVLALLRADAPLAAQLRAVRTLGLSSWCIAAGAVRNRVWDARFPAGAPQAPSDVDVVHHSAHLPPEADAEMQGRLRQALPGVAWEVTNQAWVHRWYPPVDGQPVPALPDLASALATWPETATAVGVTLDLEDHWQLLAPLGLDDLWHGVVRHHPARASVAVYRERCARQRWAERWPGVRVMAA